MPEADPNQTRAETIEQPAVFRISVAFRSQATGAGLEYRVLTPQEASPTCAAWLISRVFTVRSAAGGLLETRAGAHSGCKMQTASICGWSVYAAGYH